MLSEAAVNNPLYALLPADSFAVARTPGGRALMDSAKLAAAVQRARAEALHSARSWVATQPTTLRAHGAMVNAYVSVGELQRRAGGGGPIPAMATPLHPELPFVEARMRFASGEIDRAAAQLRTALDTVAPEGFPTVPGHSDRAGRHRRRRQVFAYQGDLDNAAKAHRPGRSGAARGRSIIPGWMHGDAKGESLAPGHAG